MKKKMLFTLMLLFAATPPVFSQQQNPITGSSELMTIIVTGGAKAKLINISGGERGFEQKRVKATNAQDYAEALATVNKYLEQGWQVKSNNYNVAIDNDALSTVNNYLYFLLERKEQ